MQSFGLHPNSRFPHWFEMKIFHRVVLVGFAFAACAAPGCQPIQFEWQGPSRTFRNIDINGDGVIVRPEWEEKYGTHVSAADAAVVQFENADCQRDGRLSWGEYFRSRFKGKSCFSDISKGLIPVGRGERRDATPLQLRNTTVAVDTSTFLSQYSEGGVAESVLDEIQVLCRPTKWDKQAICSVNNRMRNRTLSLIVMSLSVEGAPPGRSISETHAKSTWVAPGGSAEFMVHSPLPISAVTAEIISIRVLIEQRVPSR